MKLNSFLSYLKLNLEKLLHSLRPDGQKEKQNHDEAEKCENFRRINTTERRHVNRKTSSERRAPLEDIHSPPAGASGCFLSVYRFHNHRNLQLCFINNSDSEDEEEGSNKKVTFCLFFKERTSVVYSLHYC